MSGDETVRRGLTKPERIRLYTYETTIEKGLATFIEVGNALVAIRDQRLYRSGYRTFEEYCRKRWNFTDSRARQLAGAAQTVTTVTEAGLPAPTNERQVRELARVPEEDRPEVWKKALERTGGKPTAKAVKEVAEPEPSPADDPEGGRAITRVSGSPMYEVRNFDDILIRFEAQEVGQAYARAMDMVRRDRHRAWMLRGALADALWDTRHDEPEPESSAGQPLAPPPINDEERELLAEGWLYEGMGYWRDQPYTGRQVCTRIDHRRENRLRQRARRKGLRFSTPLFCTAELSKDTEDGGARSLASVTRTDYDTMERLLAEGVPCEDQEAVVENLARKLGMEFVKLPEGGCRVSDPEHPGRVTDADDLDEAVAAIRDLRYYHDNSPET